MRHFEKNKNQDGITLIVAVVLLAAVTFISFSISTIVIREIVASRLTLRSEPALSAANSGGEVGLYRLFREAGGTTATGNLAQSGVSYQVTSDLYDNVYLFNAPYGQETRVLLYDAENPNNLSADYGSVQISLDSSSGGMAYKVFSWGDVENPVCLGTLAAGQTTAPCVLDKADDRYIITINPNGSTASTGNVTATNNSGAPRGIPSDSPSLDVKGTNGPVQRRIQINL